jgi:hypothetical protein
VDIFANEFVDVGEAEAAAAFRRTRRSILREYHEEEKVRFLSSRMDEDCQRSGVCYEQYHR